MRLNRFGSAALGVGDGRVSIDGHDIDRGGGASFDGPSWITDAEIAYQHIGHEGLYVAFGSRDFGVRRAVSDPAAKFYGWGCNEISAGGGVWAAWLNEQGFGLFTSHGVHLPHAGPATVGPDGAMVYRPLYHSEGPCEVLEPNGEVWTLNAWGATDFHVLGDRRILWREGFAFRSVNLPPPRHAEGGVWRPRAVETAGRWWLCYYSEHFGFILHPFDALEGYVVQDPGIDAFRHDVVAVAHGVIRIGWSAREGEHPEDLELRDVDVEAGTIFDPLRGGLVPIARRSFASKPVPKPKPKPEPNPEPSPMPIPNHIETVRRVRAKYGARPTDEELGLMLNEIAWELRGEGFGLSAKPSGVRVPSPQGVDVAHDVLHKMPEDVIVDVFIAAGERAEPTWNIVEHHRDANRPWVAPVKPAGVDEPHDPPQPACDCAEDLAALRADVEAQHALIHELLDKVSVLEQRPAPSLPKMRVRGSTSREWGHAHSIDLELEVVPE